MSDAPSCNHYAPKHCSTRQHGSLAEPHAENSLSLLFAVPVMHQSTDFHTRNWCRFGNAAEDVLEMAFHASVVTCLVSRVLVPLSMWTEASVEGSAALTPALSPFFCQLKFPWLTHSAAVCFPFFSPLVCFSLSGIFGVGGGWGGGQTMLGQSLTWASLAPSPAMATR